MSKTADKKENAQASQAPAFSKQQSYCSLTKHTTNNVVHATEMRRVIRKARVELEDVFMYKKTSTKKATLLYDPDTGEWGACVNPFAVTTGEEYEAVIRRIYADIEKKQGGGKS